MATLPQASFAIQALVSKHKTPILVSSVKTYLKLVGKGLGLWLGLAIRGGWREENKANKGAKQIEQKF